jgi:ABC-type branched-subunit amino acid transport system substrate-binding protein
MCRMAALLVLSSLPFAFPPARAQQVPRFVVAVVGANTGGERAVTTGADWPCEKDVPGDVLPRGAALALGSVQLPIDLRVLDDGGCKEDARATAALLARDPRVLAVIGHATSATTQAAAAEYARAGVPLLAPMATSPAIFHPDNSGKRFTNVFRLPPGDLDAQGPALAFLAEVLDPNARGAVVVQDVSARAVAYTDPLAKAVVSGLRSMHSGAKEALAWNPKADPPIADQVRKLNPAVVVYCGYPGVFRQLRGALAVSYRDTPRPDWPVLLLADGAKGGASKDDKLNADPFEAYLTYPIPDIAATRYPEEVRNDIKRGYDEYEIYAYDAMSLLIQAYGSCRQKGQAGRACVLDRLRLDHSLFGGASVYSFAEGENQLAPYHVYRVDGNAIRHFCTIEPFTIPKIRLGAPPADSDCAAALRQTAPRDSR